MVSFGLTAICLSIQTTPDGSGEINQTEPPKASERQEWFFGFQCSNTPDPMFQVLGRWSNCSMIVRHPTSIDPNDVEMTFVPTWPGSVEKSDEIAEDVCCVIQWRMLGPAFEAWGARRNQGLVFNISWISRMLERNQIGHGTWNWRLSPFDNCSVFCLPDWPGRDDRRVPFHADAKRYACCSISTFGLCQFTLWFTALMYIRFWTPEPGEVHLRGQLWKGADGGRQTVGLGAPLSTQVNKLRWTVQDLQ